MTTCEHDTTLVYKKMVDPYQVFVRAVCEMGTETGGCGFYSTLKECSLNSSGAHYSSFTDLAELHIEHKIWSRDRDLDFKPDEPVPADSAVVCERCGHKDQWHWSPESGHTTTACVRCMDERKATEWMNSDGTIRTGICDHTAEWVKEPW